MHCVIIGAGVCGTSAAETLRKLDAKVQITLIGNEPHPLYSRVMLPHYISGKVPRERVFLKKDGWYSEQSIAYITDTVTAVHPREQQIVLASGDKVAYDQLLIAGGGDVRQLPFPEDKIYHLQTIEDADRLFELLPTLSPTAKTAIVGGGFISMEFINLFSQQQTDIEIFLRGDRFFSRSFDEKASKQLEAHLERHGVAIYKNTTVEQIGPDGTLRLEGGFENTYDAIGVGIGLDANFSWLDGSDVRMGTGVYCDSALRTGIRNIWTAGDCAEYFDERLQSHLHVGNWMNAQMQGRHVAKNMLGDPQPFDLVSSYATDVLEMDLISVGDVTRSRAERILEREHEEGLTQLFLKDGALRGAVLINANADRAGATALIKSQKDLSHRTEQLTNPDTPLNDFL